jgi:hypothetical protein
MNADGTIGAGWDAVRMVVGGRVYVADLETWSPITQAPWVRAVGWLAKDGPVSRGALPREFIDRLRDLAARSAESGEALEWPLGVGFHVCELCGGHRSSGNIGVPGKGVLYVAPEMIIHYVESHAYAPPIEFVDAVLRCPMPGTPEYRTAVQDFVGRKAGLKRMKAPEGAMAKTKADRPTEIVVFSVLNALACSGCRAEIARDDLLRMEKERPLCLACADLDHLVYLAAGDPALSRRSRKHSTLSAVVVRFSRARKRYERQGLLVELPALELAERECLDDQEQRARARARAGLARERADAQYVRAFAEQVQSAYPACPEAEAEAIAAHACQKYSGRIGRSGAARELDPGAITLAVAAHVRHRHSRYDELLAQGWERGDARHAVADVVQDVLKRWSSA